MEGSDAALKLLHRHPQGCHCFGGGTDLPSFTKSNLGIVINLAINLRSHVTLYTGEDLFSVDNNVFPTNAKPELFYKILTEFKKGSMHHVRFESSADAVIGAGLGTSGSSSVALIKAVYKTIGVEPTRKAIAEQAFNIENKLWNTGRQDVYASAYGGMNIMHFGKIIDVEPIPKLWAENIKKHLFLFYLGGVRKPQPKSLTNLLEIKKLAKEAINNLSNPEALGRLLNTAWELKKQSNPNVSNGRIDKIYDLAINAGALGGKVCGSGGAGYIIFMTSDKKQLVKALKQEGIEEVDYDIDYNGVEARII